MQECRCHERPRNVVFVDEPQRLFGIEPAHDDVRAPEHQVETSERQGGRVIQGSGGEMWRTGFQVERAASLGPRDGSARPRGASPERALRLPRCSGGVQHRAGRSVGGGRRLFGRRVGKQVFEPEPTFGDRFGAPRNRVPNDRNTGACGIDRSDLFGAGEDDDGIGIVQLVSHLRGLQPVIHRNPDAGDL